MMTPPQISTSPSNLNDGNGLHMASAASLTLQSAAAPRPNGSLCSPPPPLLLAPVAIAPLGQQLAVRSPPLAESAAVSPAAKIQPLVPTLTASSVQIFALGQLIDGTTSITMKTGANQRIISQAPSISQTNGVGIKGVVPNMMLETLPLICKQSPSPPSSPTSPCGDRLSLKKPSPLSVDALQRFDLLSPNYVPSMHYTRLAPPISPGYPTSDLGSSPRSPISVAPHSANWQMFRELRHKRYNSNSSDYVDGDSDIYGKAEYLMTPSQLLSPAPFSPLSDYGASNTDTPYSSRSPNLSPLPTHALNANSALHFSFDQVRSRSSMSNRNGTCGNTPFDNKSPRRRHQYHNRNRHSPMHPRSLDSDDRERSRSEGEMLKKARGYNEDDEEEDGEYVDGIDTSINHSTFLVPSRTSCFGSSSYKKRLLQKHRKSSLQATINIPDTVAAAAQPNAAVGPSSILGRAGELDEKEQQNELLRRQPTIKEPPPSPTFAELFHSRNLDKDRQTQVAEWIRQQASALETFRNLLVPLRQEANLLQVPKNTHVPQPSMEQLSQIFVPSGSQDSSPGPMRLATLWRRSRSESDVSVPINDAAYICEHCGQGFAMHDRLAKHIASRHRDRNTSMNDEKNKIHKCKMCPKSFGRSDMLTRHMRLHTGIKPYSCQICGQVFSRSDHLSTHQRTHTGEKPYRCPHCFYAASRRDMITRHMRIHLRPDGTPLGLNELQIPIGKLSLNQPPTPEPAHATVSEARSVSPAVFRHRPPSSVSPDGMPLGLNELQMPISKLSLPNVNNLSSQSASSLCSAIASTDAYTADNEKIDVKASSSAEKMELGKLESPATTSGHLAALQSSQDSATIHENSKDSVDLLVDSQSYKASNCSERAQDEPQSSVRTPALSSVHRILLDPPSQIFRENRQSKLGPIVMSSLPIAHDGLAPSFASTLEGATVHNTLLTATGDIGALSAALLLPQQMLSTNLATADPQLNAAAADSVAAKVLSVALAATSANSAIGLMNSTEINKNCSMPANDGVFLPATGLNSASLSKIFTADKHQSTFQSPSYISGQNVPNHNVENSTSSQIDLLKLMTQLLGANPQLLADSLQPPAGPADDGGLGTLLRQNSIGGIGFADAAQHSTQS